MSCAINSCALLLTLLFPVMLPESCRADIIVDIPNVTLAPGGATSIDILVSSNSSDELDLFDYVFSIAPVGSPSGSLTFSAVQAFTPASDLNYVLSGQSANFSLFSGFSGLTATGGDETNQVDPITNFPNTTLLGPTLSTIPSLLVRLDIEHDNALATADEFQISLTSASFLTDVELNLFGNIAVDTPIAFSSNTGTVLVSSAAAVPEPSSVLLLAIGTGIFWRVRSFRRSETNAVTDGVDPDVAGPA